MTEIDTHADKAAELIRNLHAKGSDILASAAKTFIASIEALNTVNAEFLIDLGALNLVTESQMQDRIAETQRLQREMMDHFTGVVPLKEPIITFTAPQPAMPQASDGPSIDGFPPEEPFPAVVNGADARANGAA
jgi:hypothetical protein